MSYFHPWTLRAQDSDEHVPFAGHLRKVDETWQEALGAWLDGRILCKEAKKYVGNFLSVHRVRPEEDDGSDVGNSDDFVSDEELKVSPDALAEALATRIGGRERKEDTDNKEAAEGVKRAIEKIHA